MKVLLVSDYHHFSTEEIYKGYKAGFEATGIPFDVAQSHELRGSFFNDEITWAITLAKILKKDNDFTHILFISGFSIPEWVLASKYDKKFGLIAVDDPHSSLKTLAYKKYLDYYFTNEKTLEDEANGIYYVPTASTVEVPNCTKDEVPSQFRSDVVFVGTIYENRVKPLNAIAEYCRDNGLTFRCIGQSSWIPDDSALYNAFESRIVPVNEAKLLYRGSRAVINIDRDVNWKSNNAKFNQYLVKRDEEEYSLNPRAYEIALSRTPQLFINPRQGAKDTFGDNAFYCSAEKDDINNTLDTILNLDKQTLKTVVKNSYTEVINNHTYNNRAKQIIEILKKEK
jgi:hypothetical protein